jgi:hypothetical protein
MKFSPVAMEEKPARNTPVFLWSLYPTSFLLALATPVLAMTLLLLAFERVFHVGVFDPKIGGDLLLGTAVHGLHMVAGLILVGWIIWRARHGEFSPTFYTPVVVVGLYWSFVDTVWIALYPLIYLVGRG